MVILPFNMLVKLLIIGGLNTLKDLYASWSKWVHRHAGSIAIVLPILIIGLIFLYGHWRGVQVVHDTESHGATFRYDKPISLELAPWVGVLYEPEGVRGAVGVELGYIQPIHIDIIGSIPLFEEVDFNRIALGIGVSTPIRANFFIGASYNREIFSDNQRDFWGIYGKIRF